MQRRYSDPSTISSKRQSSAPNHHWAAIERFALALFGALCLSICAAILVFQLTSPDAWRIDRNATAAEISAQFRATAGDDGYLGWVERVNEALGPGDDGGSVDHGLVSAWLAAGPDMAGHEAMAAAAALNGYQSPRLPIDFERRDRRIWRDTLDDLMGRQITRARNRGVAPPQRIFLPAEVSGHPAWSQLSDNELLGSSGFGASLRLPRASARIERRNLRDVIVYGELAYLVIEACRRARNEAALATCASMTTQTPPPSELLLVVSIAEAGLTGGSTAPPDWTPEAREGASAVMAAARAGDVDADLARLIVLRAGAAIDVQLALDAVEQTLTDMFDGLDQPGQSVDALIDAAATGVRERRITSFAAMMAQIGRAYRVAPSGQSAPLLAAVDDLDDLESVLAAAEQAGERWPALWTLFGEDVGTLTRRELTFNWSLLASGGGVLVGSAALVAAFSRPRMRRVRSG